MSNKYLYLNGELRGPVTMERHDKEYFYGRPYSTGMDSYDLESWEQHKKDWKTHIESLPRIPIEGNHSFKENQIYEEGKDFDIKYSNGFDIKDHVDHFDESHFGYDTSIHQVSIPVDQSHKGKPDCSGHPRELYGEKDMKVMAEAIGNLHYQTLSELFFELQNKLHNDAIRDLKGQRFKLFAYLNRAKNHLLEASSAIESAWVISKPHMTTE